MPVILATQETRDKEDCGSKPAQANSSQDNILKIPITKMVGCVAQGEGLSSSPSTSKKKKKERIT
jgi:hypothetical protein